MARLSTGCFRGARQAGSAGARAPEAQAGAPAPRSVLRGPHPALPWRPFCSGFNWDGYERSAETPNTLALNLQPWKQQDGRRNGGWPEHTPWGPGRARGPQPQAPLARPSNGFPASPPLPIPPTAVSTSGQRPQGCLLTTPPTEWGAAARQDPHSWPCLPGFCWLEGPPTPPSYRQVDWWPLSLLILRSCWGPGSCVSEAQS